MRKALLTLLMAALALCLCGCSVLPAEPAAVAPDVRLLERPVYADEAVDAIASGAAQQSLRVDLWLDASHIMGGINLNEESIYPHFSRKYREGGFHYRYEDTVGMYETLLRCMLSTAEGSRIRMLRFGDERLTDDFLSAHFDRTVDLRSIRRDMLTFAIDPMPTVFSGMSAEKMDNSFYAVGSEMLNQAGGLNAALLENPTRAQEMANLLSTQIRRIADGDQTLTALSQDADYPLLYALDNLDLDRLSIITCDPAAIRKTTVIEPDGTQTDLIARILEERGVFDKGLSVGLYAFTLDYLGQLSSFSTADFAEPLVWGHLKYNTKKGRSEGVLPMPRTLLTLVVGPAAQLENYTSALDAAFAQAPALKALRGPEKGELSYTRNGQTVTQQPFSFDYEYTQIDRPQLTVYTQHTENVTLTGDNVDETTRLVRLVAGQENRFSVTVPVQDARAQIVSPQLAVSDALTLTQTLPNLPDTVVPADAQVIALRDKLYVYQQHKPQESPFQLETIRQDDGAVTFALKSSENIEPGYYHVALSADYAGNLAWETAPWVNKLSCSFTGEQISQWEEFSRLISQYERRRDTVSRPFQHAWGPATDALYHGMAYPDFPPVTQVPQLSSLVSQLQSAANVQQTPCVRYTFDVFVQNP